MACLSEGKCYGCSDNVDDGCVFDIVVFVEMAVSDDCNVCDNDDI